jgi:hypothetical protein
MAGLQMHAQDERRIADHRNSRMILAKIAEATGLTSAKSLA